MGIRFSLLGFTEDGKDEKRETYIFLLRKELNVGQIYIILNIPSVTSVVKLQDINYALKYL